jgi:hypothetical protein
METLKTKKVSVVLQFFNEGLIFCFNCVFFRGHKREPPLFFDGTHFLRVDPTSKKKVGIGAGTFYFGYASLDSS